MKKTFKKSISVLLAVIMVLTAIAVNPFTANAVSTAGDLDTTELGVWADPTSTLTQADIDAYVSGTKTTMTGAVGVFKRSSGSSNYYLFLPSNADCNNLRIWFKGYSERSSSGGIGDIWGSGSGDTTTPEEITYAAITADGVTTELINGEATNAFAAIDAGGISKQYTLTLNKNTYTVTALKSGDVGTVFIDTQSGSIKNINASGDKSVSESGTIMVIAPNGTVHYDGTLEKMSGRGNGTWSTGNTKNPYNIKLGVSTSLLGMGKAKKWCLLANAGDASLIKNQLTYDFADYIGIKYQPHCKPVDLYVNQQYFGAYNLAEKVEIKSNRIDVTDAYENLEIANGTVDPATGLVVPKDLTGTSVTTYNPNKLNTNTINAPDHTVTAKKYSPNISDPSDYTGGYFYELEISQRWPDENAGFCAYNRQGWVIKSCDYATQNMVDYSYDLLYALGSSVYNKGVVPSTSTSTNCSKANDLSGGQIGGLPVYGSKSITNPAPAVKYQGKKWSDILDKDSAVRYYWTQEYFKNMDSSTSSTYFYKDSDSIDPKLYAGPMWDMDNSIGYNSSGSRWGASWTSSTGWYTKVARMYRWRSNDATSNYSADNQSPLNFYAALATNCTDFWQTAESYWFNYIEPATQILLGNKEDPKGKLHSTEYYASKVAKSGTMNNLRHNLANDGAYDASAVTSGMNNWFTERNNWINTQIGQIDINQATVSAIPDQYCNGSAIMPQFTVTYNGTTLVEGVDYTATYSNNTQATTQAAVILTGKGLYTGTKTVNFAILAGSLVDGSATISDIAYKGDTLSAVVKNADGQEITQFLNYQWKVNGTNINGATSSTYVIDDAYEGASITVTVTGDGKNIASAGITSNTCTVAAGTRPTGYSKTIASWDYDYSADPLALTTADATGTSYYYLATSGENAATAQLTASVDAANRNRIKWSGSADIYTNSSVSTGIDQTPVMGTSKTDGLAWGEYPYFETAVSTLGYENIKFSAKLGGTKKGPRDWKLQYSLDGVSYTDIDTAQYKILKNKTMEQAFEDVSIPVACNNQKMIYIRMVVCSNAAINNINTIIGQTSGDAAVNNIKITGASTAVVTSLDAPSITTTSVNTDTAYVFDSDNIVITDNNGGADVYYSINGSTPALYTGEFSPFDKTTAKKGDRVEISAYANFEDITSDVTTFEAVFAGVNLNSFNFDNYSQNVSNGAVFSNGGIYGESGKMTAYTDGVSQYVPLWNASNGAYSIAPDDGAKWSADSGFYFEVSTAGYTNTAFTCKAYTTNQGPKSVSLQYSLDAKTWKDVQSNTALAPTELAQLYLTVKLPQECDNLAKVYIRVATQENATFLNATLHNGESKGNLYINNIVVSGEDNGDYKMPYTNKTTGYFGTGTIKYHSPSGVAMQYTVTNPDGGIMLSGAYSELEGIMIQNAQSFNPTVSGPYTVTIWAGDDDDRSISNVSKYYYKGEDVTSFSFTDTKRPLANYLNETSTAASNTSGANAGTLAMYPNGTTAALLDYTNSYGVKVAWAENNIFKATKQLDKVDGNGYWLIETSTAGFTNLSLNLEQISSNKGPRDWGLAYSLNGRDYTYIPSSNAKAISNDAAISTVETYNNFALPSACDNQEKVYIKVFINGGESVDGTELELVTKGNTGINAIELSGIAMPVEVDVTVNTVALENKTDIDGTLPVDATIVIDGTAYNTENGTAVLKLVSGVTYTAEVAVNGTFVNTVEIYAQPDGYVTVPVVCVDMNSDGVINLKDYQYIKALQDTAKKEAYLNIFKNFVNVKDNSFNYAK